jgi:hypothetical protein
LRSLWRLSLLYLLHIELWYILFSEEMRDSLDNIPLFSDFSESDHEQGVEQPVPK